MKFPVLLAAILASLAPAAVDAQFVENYSPSTPPNLAIPDGSTVGVVSTINIPTSLISDITSVQVSLNISGGFNGDYYVYLVHYLPGGVSAGFVNLLNRTGTTASDPFGYGDSGFTITFSDAAANGDVHNYQNVFNPAGGALTGTWAPDGRSADPFLVTDASPRTNSLAAFNGTNAAGDWTLFVADVSSAGLGTFVTWGLTIQGVPEPGTYFTGALALAAVWAARRRRTGR